MSEVANPKSNKYSAAQEIVLEVIKAGNLKSGHADYLAKEINTLYKLIIDGFDETHNR